MEKQVTGIRKRQQIKKANNTMFLWVVAASAAITICLVLAQFLVRQMVFNQSVISKKRETNAVLKQNEKTFESIKTEVSKLAADSRLSALKVDPADSNIQVIIDALPTTDDRAALATSLQQVVLARSGVAIESLSATDNQTRSTSSSSGAVLGSDAPASITFSAVLMGTYDQITRAVGDMERSIRPIAIERLEIEGSGDRIRATLTASTYYLPAKSVELQTEGMKP